MAWTSADLDRIRAAIARGELTVQFADRSTTYRSIEELIAAEQHIASALTTTTRKRVTLGVADKGFQR